MVLAALAIALLTTGCLPPLLDPPTSGLAYGKGPLDAIREAADRTTTTDPYDKCGLSSTDLAAMMMVPTYYEAGGPVPAPMALSRWDNVGVWSLNVNLFAFGQTSGPYVNAFFSPGIGLWQFDSAGGWDLTAADAIDSVTAANTAAATMAYRWCTAPPSRLASPQLRRQYAWGPWFGCTSGTKCEDRFQQLVTNGSLNVGPDMGVDRYGGMQQRTCNVAGLGSGLTCWYVNPASAQGSTAWRSWTYDPNNQNYVTPLPKPFYVVRADGREYRFWIKADTGYDIGITASHPVTTNARTSIVWERQALLCDTTASRGECGGNNPVGYLDLATPAGPGQVRVAGWAFDPDTSAPLAIHVYAGSTITGVTANGARPDIAVAFPGVGGSHGFDAVVPASAGSIRVCAYAIDVGGGANMQIGCRDVTVTGPPAGSIDAVRARPGTIVVSGWAAVPGDSAASPSITVDGGPAISVTRTVARPDVAAVAPWAGPTSGFSVEIPASGGSHRVCLGAGGSAPDALGCRSITLPSGPPFGSLDVASGRPGGMAVAGWAIDPDTAAPIPVHFYVDGAFAGSTSANGVRSDVEFFLPAYGPKHGFSTTVAAAGGSRQVCAYGINVGVGYHVALGCRQVLVPTGSPFGSIDAVTRVSGGVLVAGWAVDPDTASSISLHVYVGPTMTPVRADRSRPDVGAVLPGYGDAHGYSAVLPVPAGPVNVCIYALETAGSGAHVLLGCRTV